MSSVVASAEHFPSDNLLIVLGKNIGVGSSPEDISSRPDHLSRESRMNALAAGKLWVPGTDILFSTGQTAGPDVPAEAAAMKAYFKRRYPHIPAHHLLTEEISIDTAGNAEEVAKILADRRYRRIGLVSVGYHVENAAKLFGRYGVKVTDTHVAEEAMQEGSHLYASWVRGWTKTDRIKQERKKELFRKMLLVVDRKGKLPRLVTTKTRK